MADELVTIARFEEAPQAHEARIVLEDAGIDCFVGDLATSVWPDGVGGGVKLLVREEDAEMAVGVLRDTPAAKDLVVELEGETEADAAEY